MDRPLRHAAIRTNVNADRTVAPGSRVAWPAAIAASFLLAACAGGENGLPSLEPLSTGSLPNPVEAVSGQMSEMAKATGMMKAPARERLEELQAIDRRCYAITARDEVWQAVKQAQAEAKPGEGGQPPPVADPWTPENKTFYMENCTEEAQQARSLEMRNLHL